MPRGKRKSSAHPQERASLATDAPVAFDDKPAEPADPAQSAPTDATPKKQWTSSVPDPFGRHSIDLGDGRRLQLNRSAKWQQVQIQFVANQEGVDAKPKIEDGDMQWLGERGWQWRGDANTKAWTMLLLAAEEKELADDDNIKR